MLVVEIFIAVYLIGSYIHFRITRNRENLKTKLLKKHIHTSNELKQTLAMGLYLRFRKEREEYNPKIIENDLFVKQDPFTFEHFVAEVFEATRGGTTWVSPPVGDHGVDFEHIVDDELYLGQVKCLMKNMDFEPIAILHSNMIKQNAVGGYVITTCSFTEPARQYAKGLNIELIDGIQLVELWLEGLENLEEDILKTIPDYV